MDIISFLFLVSVSVPIAVWRKVAMERAIIISIGCLSFLGYIGGILGNFWYLLLPAEGLLLGLMVLCVYKKRITIKELMSPGIIFLLILLVISVIYHRNTVVTSWDDLAGWAAETKNMFYNNKFPCAAGNTISRYTDYLPGVQLFSVIWMKVGNVFNDSRLFVSYNMLAYIFLSAFLTNIRGKSKIVIFSLILAVAPNAFLANMWSMLSTLQIDTMVAAMFGYLLYLIYSEEYDVIELYAGVIMLCLSKQVGCLFGLVVVGLLCIKQIYQMVIKKNESGRVLYVIIGEFLFIVSSWFVVKKKYNVVSTGSGVYKEILDQGIEYFSTLEQWKIEGFKNFWKSIIKFDIIDITSQTAYYISPFLKVSGIVWIILILIGLILISKKYCKRISYFYNVLLVLGFLAYTMFISSLYLLNFSKGENAVLSSAGRYVGTYLMAMYLLIFGIIFRHSKETMLNVVNIVFGIMGLTFPCNNLSSILVGGGNARG